MLTKAWIAVLLGLLLGSLFFTSGCGCFDDSYYGSPYGSQAPPVTGAPTGVTPGWKPASGGAAASASSANGGTAPAAGS